MGKHNDLSDTLIDIIKAAAVAIIGFIIIKALLQAAAGS